MKSKKILILYTGGTFGMQKGTTGQQLKIPRLTPEKLRKSLLNRVPEIQNVADCDVEVLFNLDSCQFQPLHWYAMAQAIRSAETHYDGVVILHGTDTLAYTAAALSFLLGKSKLPVVITGAQKPLADLRNDARQNLISAVEIAASAPISLCDRVLVHFHDQLFLGSRVRKKSATQFAAFESPRFPALASVGSTIAYHEVIHHLPALKKPTHPFKPIHPQIPHLTTTPGFCTEIFLNPALIESVDGILLTLYPSGTAPTAQKGFLEGLTHARRLHCPVFAITEREAATSSLEKYASGKEISDSGVLWCENLTPEAAWVKAQLLLSAASDQSRRDRYRWIHRIWKQRLSDEL